MRIIRLNTVRRLAALATVAAGGLALASAASAHDCAGKIAQIDAAMPKAGLSADETKKVTELRAKGKKMMEDGEHHACFEPLREAGKILRAKSADSK